MNPSDGSPIYGVFNWTAARLVGKGTVKDKNTVQAENAAAMLFLLHMHIGPGTVPA